MLSKHKYTTELCSIFTDEQKKHDLLFSLLIASSIKDNPIVSMDLIDFPQLHAELDILRQKQRAKLVF